MRRKLGPPHVERHVCKADLTATLRHRTPTLRLVQQPENMFLAEHSLHTVHVLPCRSSIRITKKKNFRKVKNCRTPMHYARLSLGGADPLLCSYNCLDKNLSARGTQIAVTTKNAYREINYYKVTAGGGCFV